MDLNELIGAEAEILALCGYRINDKGQIVAYAQAYRSGAVSAVLLTPVAPRRVAARARPIGNTVAIKLAEYYAKDQLLVIQATITGESSSGAADTVKAYYPSGKMIGTMSSMGNGLYIGKFIQVETNPKEITVTSSIGGSAVSIVTEK